MVGCKNLMLHSLFISFIVLKCDITWVSKVLKVLKWKSPCWKCQYPDNTQFSSSCRCLLKNNKKSKSQYEYKLNNTVSLMYILLYVIFLLCMVLRMASYSTLVYTLVTSRDVLITMAYQEGESLESWLSEWFLQIYKLKDTRSRAISNASVTTQSVISYSSCQHCFPALSTALWSWLVDMYIISVIWVEVLKCSVFSVC